MRRIFAIPLLAISLAACSQETPLDTANKINTACEEEFTSMGNSAVSECEIRHYAKEMDDMQQDRDHRVDQAAGQ